MTTRGQRFDVFCRVVDNFGDAGIALRLSRQLAAEHSGDVTLWIDDIGPLIALTAGAIQRSIDQRHAGVRIRRLEDLSLSEQIGVPDVIVELFGCGLSDAYLDAMEQTRRPPVWINLEYLSAESWVDTRHGLPSPHPTRALERWFMFPGFTPATGGLLRERDLLVRRDHYRGLPERRTLAWTALGLPAPDPKTLTVSLFCYPNDALPALFAAWINGDKPIACIVPEGVATDAVQRLVGRHPAAPGEVREVGALTLAIAPFVDSDAFDRRLWSSDLNFVRGEDSFVRAQWAAQPFVWHIYPQAERAHDVKLDAFLGRYVDRLDPAARAPLARFWHAFNEQDSRAVAAVWPEFRDTLPALRAHAMDWASTLAIQNDLATQLVDFSRKRL